MKALEELDLIDAEAAAAIVHVTAHRIRAFARAGRLGQRIGRQYVFSRSSVERFSRIPRRPGRPSR